MSRGPYHQEGLAFANFGGNEFYWYRPLPTTDVHLIFICNCGPYTKRFVYLQRHYYENGELVLVDKIASFKVRRTSVPRRVRLLARGILT